MDTLLTVNPSLFSTEVKYHDAEFERCPYCGDITACFVYLQIQERILSPFSRLVIKVSCCDQISILHQGRLKKKCAIKKENNSS